MILGKINKPASATAPINALAKLPFDNSSLAFKTPPATPNLSAHFFAEYFLLRNSSTLETSLFAFAFRYF